MGAMALPSAETYQAHGAERVLVLPRGGRTTFVVDMGEG
jgi:trafficking protein particle complex subunit 10